MSKITKVIFLSLMYFCFFCLSQFPQSSISAAPEKDAETQACSENLFGTVSKEFCQAICPEGTEYGCLKVKDFPGKNPTDPSQDLECYTCARDQYCSDLGYMDVWDCWLCDANPATECVKAGVTVPLTGTTVGGKTWSGEQCYDCVARPDRCNQKWPGTTWLADCQKTCVDPDKKCVLVGVHDGNDCYRCEEKIAECKDMGLLKEVECAPCNADPKTQCVPWAMTKNMEKCFKCIPKNQPVPPQPPPPGQPEKSCASLGYAVSAAVCRGQGMDWRLVDVPEIGEKCIECIKKKEDCSPNLTHEGCQKYCEAIGGRCMAMTRTKEGPECYTCYWGEQQKQGCAYYDMPEGCEPNPCFENETCVMIDKPLRLRCAHCQENENWKEPTTCEEHQMFPNCATCYNAQMACENIFLKDANVWCSKCFERPTDSTQTSPEPPKDETTVVVPEETVTQVTSPIPAEQIQTAPTFKIAENESPRPQDRVFFNYNYFQDAQVNQNNYPGVMESPMEQMCDGGEEMAGSRVKDSVNWGGLFGPNGSDDGGEMLNLPQLNLSLDYFKYGGGMTQIDPPAQTDPQLAAMRLQQEDLKQEKVNLQEQITNMEKALTKPEVTKNPMLKEMTENTLNNARTRVGEVDKQLGNLSSAIEGNLRMGGADFSVPRQWAEVKTPIGRLDFGRIGSHWGMGIFNGEYLEEQGPGAALGLGGPLVVSGTVNKEPAVAIFDAAGVPVGSVTRQQAIDYPDMTRDYLQTAESRSQQYFFPNSSGSFAESLGLVEAPDELEERIKNKWVEFISKFQPASVLVPQLGMYPGDMNTLASSINHQLKNKVKVEILFDPFHCCALIYIEDPIFGRHILAKKEITPTDPNDPLYFKSGKNSAGGKAGGVVKSFTKVLLGSGFKMGDGTMGGGDSSISLRQDPGADIVDQWGIRKVGYLPKSDPNSAWDVIDGQTKNVLVAVIDSGLDIEHPDAPQYVWTNAKEIPDNKMDDDKNGYVDDIHGWNFFDENNDLRDFKGHGSIVAGIIAAKSNNALGIAGINPGAEIMVLKVTDKKGQTNSLNIYRAIHYAVNHGARVMNISLGAKGVSQLEQLAVNYARSRGVFVAVAIGNDGEHVSQYGPAMAKGVVAVGALDYQGTRSTVSNWGPNIALLAPGEGIYSLQSKDAEWDGPAAIKDRRFTKASGTSFSTPMVAATAALLLAKNPQLTNSQLEDIILSTAVDMKEKGWDGLTGAGILDAAAALRVDTGSILNVGLSELRVNRVDKKVQSVDVFGTVKGNLQEFTVELGRGKNPSKWEKVGGPYKSAAANSWLCRIPDKSVNKGTGDWAVRIKAVGKDGQEKIAESPIPFTTEKKRYDWEKEK